MRVLLAVLPGPSVPLLRIPGSLSGIWPPGMRPCSVHCSNPKIATLFVLATKTFPLITSGAMNLLPEPN